MMNSLLKYRAAAAFLAFAMGVLTTIAYAEPGDTGMVNVQMKTNLGTIEMQLDAKRAPKTVENFLKYVKSKHFEGTVFHRVIDNFMIQGGGFDEKLVEKKTLPPIPNEGGNGLKNTKYSIAMARTPDPNSATAQFFINTKDNGFLNRAEAQDGYGYAVFGHVVKGKDIVDKIGKVKTGVKPNPKIPQMLMRDVPVDAVIIQSVTIVEDK